MTYALRKPRPRCDEEVALAAPLTRMLSQHVMLPAHMGLWGFHLWTRRKEVWYEDTQFIVRPLQYMLLECLVISTTLPEGVLMSEIESYLYNVSPPPTNSTSVMLSSLRKKIKKETNGAVVVGTLRPEPNVLRYTLKHMWLK